MLEPNDRKLIVEILRPPEGFELDSAIGTTYSLDLIALLSVPLSFSRFDWENSEGDIRREPNALLEALRRHSEQMTVFCQAGEIYAPAAPNPLIVHLESAVVQVSSPSGGVFHPKIWVLRFVDKQEGVYYRFACLSRNLTFDNSWDTSLVLEGKVKDRQRGYSVNRPLSSFLAYLTILAKDNIDPKRKKKVNEIADEILRVEFVPPDGIQSFQFHPLGIEGYRKSFLGEGIERILIASPFVDEDILEMIHGKDVSSMLVSRIDTLNAIGRKQIHKCKKVYVLSDSAEPEKLDTSTTENEDQILLEGLHAKCFVIESGRTTHLYTGSANATNAALSRNVEFMVKLTGPRGRIGIDALLEQGGKGRVTFRDLLKEFVATKEDGKVDKEKRTLELAVERAIHNLASENLSAVVSSTESVGEWAVSINTKAKKGIELSEGIVAAYCWPIGIKDSMAVKLQWHNPVLATFEKVSTAALTCFFAFRFEGHLGRNFLKKTRVISIPLLGAPEDRKERLLRAMLQNREQLLRFLLFILADVDFVPDFGDDDNSSGTGEGLGWKNSGNNTLFESMVRALHRNPRRLDEIAQIIADLEKTGESKSILPDGFQDIWRPICEVLERIRS